MKAGIAGAGIMGRLLAFHLVNAGCEVTLFDQNSHTENYSCSMVAAGLLTPVSELDKAEGLIFQLGQAALNTHWPHILGQLSDAIYFQQSGTLTLAHPNDRAELAHFTDRISRQLDQLDQLDRCEESTTHAHYQKLTQTQIKQLEPELEKFQEGYYFPHEGHIDSQALFHALGKYLHQQQVIWHDSTEVTAVAPFKISVSHETHEFDHVFDCRGLGAKSVFTDLRGVRGELIWLHAPAVQITRPLRFLHPRYSLYIVPRPQNIYLIGASEIESEDEKPITVKTSLELLTAAYYVHPGFAEAHIIRSATHCRPTLSHHLPKIKATSGLIAINGLYRHGYLIAPTIAYDVLQWLNKDSRAIHYPQLWEMQ